MSQFGQDLGLPVTWLRAELEERVAENQGRACALASRWRQRPRQHRSPFATEGSGSVEPWSPLGSDCASGFGEGNDPRDRSRSGDDSAIRINSAASRLTISPLRQATWVVRVDAENLAPVRREVDRLPAPQMISLQRSQLRSNGCSGGLRSSP